MKVIDEKPTPGTYPKLEREYFTRAEREGKGQVQRAMTRRQAREALTLADWKPMSIDLLLKGVDPIAPFFVRRMLLIIRD
jgi:hypothetical protein